MSQFINIIAVDIFSRILLNTFSHVGVLIICYNLKYFMVFYVFVYLYCIHFG